MSELLKLNKNNKWKTMKMSNFAAKTIHPILNITDDLFIEIKPNPNKFNIPLSVGK